MNGTSHKNTTQQSVANPATRTHGNLVWMDLEMTGLEPEQNTIIEIATIVTDAELNVLAEGPELAIMQPKWHLDRMDDWNTRHHNASGLVERVLKSEISMAEAEAQTLEFLQWHVGPDESPLCGNTIGQDRRFLFRYMPNLERYLNYRSVDVSTVKELVARWQPEKLKGFRKEARHEAMADIRESIAELKYYREQVFSI